MLFSHLVVQFQGELSVGTMVSFIGYTFTLTFAVSYFFLCLFGILDKMFVLNWQLEAFQVQGGVNTLGDLRRTFAAAERINSILSLAEIDMSLAYGLEKELQTTEVDINLGLNHEDVYHKKKQSKHYMLELRSASDGCNLAWSGDICLEGILFH